MAAHIPFINGDTDCELVRKFYSDSRLIRLTLEGAKRHGPKLPTGANIWVDAGVDGLHTPMSKPHDEGWKKHISQFPGYADIGNPEFQTKPDTKQVEGFVHAVLDACLELEPAAITVPQLPIVAGVSRNRINRLMALAAGNWVVRKKFGGKVILPAIFTDQKQLNKKTERNKKREVLAACYEGCQADALWTAWVANVPGDAIPRTNCFSF
jgi:hypothetical protein